MNKRALRADILLLITAGLWGFGFVAQSSGMDFLGPFTYNALRFPLALLSLLPLIFILQAKGRLGGGKGAALSGGARAACARTLLAGSVLFFAVMIQQIGMIFTTVGNAGFITGFYVVLTPVFGIFIGKKTGLPTWVGMVFALAGLYFIFAANRLSSVNLGDVILLVGAVFWTFHILVIDHLVQKLDPLILSAGQVAWCGLFSIIAAFTLEPVVTAWAARAGGDAAAAQRWVSLSDLLRPAGTFSFRALSGAVIPVLYGGLASVGIAYTLQVVAQKDAPPAHATILLCLEGVFAALGGILLRNEKPGPFTLLGFAFMLLAMFITQWDVIGRKS